MWNVVGKARAALLNTNALLYLSVNRCKINEKAMGAKSFLRFFFFFFNK